MNERDIKRLIRIVEESGIDELEVSRWGRSVRIVKRAADGTDPGSGDVFSIDPGRARRPTIPSVSGTSTAPVETPTESAAEPGLELVRAPMVGTFFRAPSPEAPAYVEVGDRVRKGQTLCILEAMKLMNEIESEYDGVVRAILAENGEPIEYGQPLFQLQAS